MLTRRKLRVLIAVAVSPFSLLLLNSPLSAASAPSDIDTLVANVIRGDLAKVKETMQTVPDINAHDSQGITALHEAAVDGKDEILKWLIDHGASVKSLDSTQKTPLVYASMAGHSTTIEILAAAGSDLNDVQSGFTPVAWAAINNRYKCVMKLIRLGADVNRSSSLGITPLMEASYSGMQRCIPGKPSVPVYSENDCEHLVRALLAAHAAPNLRDAKGQTAIFYAVRSGFPEIIRILRKSGANAAICDNNGNTPRLLAKALPRRRRMQVYRAL